MITSLQNEKIVQYAKLNKKKYRDKFSMFIVEGFHLVEEAKKNNLVIEVLTSDEQYEGTLVTQEIIKKISNTVTPQPIIAICQKIVERPLGDKVLALDNIQDPGNLGTLIRTARAFGWDSILVKGTDIYNPKVVRSTQGSLFEMNIIQTNDLTDFMGDYESIGALLDKDAKNYKEIQIKGKYMLILGNEGNGISEEVKNKLNEKVYIPIEFESLNVAQAGAILLNEYK